MQIALDTLFPRTAIFSDRIQAAVLAFAVHGTIFFLGSFGLMRGIEYGIDGSDGMAEVELIAAPAPAVTNSAEVKGLRTEVVESDPDSVLSPQSSELAVTPPAVAPVAVPLLTTTDLSGPLGDGSSAVAGTDATTIHRAGSTGAYFKPGYYRNPPPTYPEEARRLKQQGRVLLEVLVTPEGKVAGARLKQSSGFPLLDAAALKAIPNWKFKPATLGGLRIEILADIPIRFQLK